MLSPTRCKRSSGEEDDVSDQVVTDLRLPRRETVRRMPIRQYLALMLEARRTRRLLQELDARQLRDIGVSRADAESEINRALWDF
jgi:uncharacterized protein YjiS (DUF1127 family)